MVICAVCKKVGGNDTKLFDCSACKGISYCGVEHQKQDWPNHKLVCSFIKEAQSKGFSKQIIKEGTGEQPKNGNLVIVHYTGTLVDGTKFDSSRDRDDPFDFVLGQGDVIKGWDQGLLTFKIGERSKLFLSADYGYGKRGAGRDIPPNSCLIFDVELLEFK